MKRLLKDKKTGLYLRNMDEWTSDPSQAQSFHDAFQALKFCEEHHLGQISVVARTGDGAERLLAFRRASTQQPVQETAPLPQKVSSNQPMPSETA